MINFDHLRKLLCYNGLLDTNWTLKQQLIFLYKEANLSISMITALTDNYTSKPTINRILRKFNIPVRSRGGCNNPQGRRGV